jgi:hypothetical protein
MQEVDDAAVRLACEKLLLQVAWLTDHGPQVEIAKLYTVDGEFDRDGDVTRGRAAIAQMYARRPASLMTRHLVSNLQVEPISAHSARCRSMAAVYRFRSADGTRATAPVTLPGPEAVSEYDDTVVRTTEGWRIARRVLRTVIEIRPPPGGG